MQYSPAWFYKILALVSVWVHYWLLYQLCTLCAYIYSWESQSLFGKNKKKRMALAAHICSKVCLGKWGQHRKTNIVLPRLVISKCATWQNKDERVTKRQTVKAHDVEWYETYQLWTHLGRSYSAMRTCVVYAGGCFPSSFIHDRFFRRHSRKTWTNKKNKRVDYAG